MGTRTVASGPCRAAGQGRCSGTAPEAREPRGPETRLLRLESWLPTSVRLRASFTHQGARRPPPRGAAVRMNSPSAGRTWRGWHPVALQEMSSTTAAVAIEGYESMPSTSPLTFPSLRPLLPGPGQSRTPSHSSLGGHRPLSPSAHEPQFPHLSGLSGRRRPRRQAWPLRAPLCPCPQHLGARPAARDTEGQSWEKKKLGQRKGSEKERETSLATAG